MADLRAAFETFTRTQLQTVLLVARGMTNAQIANQLHVGERCVRLRIRSACERVGADGGQRFTLVLWAVEHGFVTEGEVIQWIEDGTPLE